MAKAQLTTIERLMNHVSPEPNSGCWLWMAAVDKKGYAKVGYNRPPRGYGMEFAHRVLYEQIRGPIPEGLDIDHLCRVRCCVNPDHLEPVTNAENHRRGIARNAKKTHCPQGHPYDFTYRNGNHRICRTCQNAHAAKYRLRKKAGPPFSARPVQGDAPI